ncbi:F-type H+-transporting ATPase subunit epsilon [Lachnospiraceae bacterium NK3A20]|jgi:F-type H+-transporting ATPase subunit epsilon|nr:F-type H+-transporting ATPase subunit epsilon [Lachnospiraceae bacterium NK3A20]
MSETNAFYLRVIATDKTFYKGYAKDLIIQTLDGELSFLAHHEECIVALSPGELDIQKDDGSWIHVVAGYGSMTFANNRAVVLVDTCETEEELDARRAEEALERARERLRQKQSLREYRMTQAAMARALSRLKFKGKELH